MTTEIVGVTSYANSNFSGIQLRKDGAAIGFIPNPLSAIGRRKIPPTPQELSEAKALNEKRMVIFNQIAQAWEQDGDIPQELLEQHYNSAPKSQNFYGCSVSF
ncbi:MAG: hypothetical protein KDJ35_05155 [Alphaproteobacteria bacterium]|nr:hypothetical protein [Alphaproteobacteria bacterium]